VTEVPREVELKLELDAQDATRLAETSLVRGSQGRAEALSTVYFDTENMDLREAGLSLRVREVDGHRNQTIKAKRSTAAGLFDRDEWEQEIDGLTSRISQQLRARPCSLCWPRTAFATAFVRSS
jgi:inorganic triphosphatase YgiF